MDDHKELIERLRSLQKVDSVVMENSNTAYGKAANAIESLLAENERLKHNLAVTEQTMREYQELAAKRLEEIERLKEIKMAGEIMRDLLKQRDELLAALEKCRKELSAWMRDHGDDIATQEAVADARAAIASVKGEQ